MTDDLKLQSLKSKLRTLGWSSEAVDLGIRQGFCCAYCGRDLLANITDYDAWQLDHVIPSSKGGANSTANKVVSCKLCNYAKSGFDPREIAGEDATVEELLKAAKEHVSEKRKEKDERLEEIKRILFESGVITEERATKKAD